MSFKNLPPLNGLRHFEAAARSEGFKRAADEMHVTQSAISQQIRKLEDFLGCSLFERASPTIKLTEAGRELYCALHKAFGAIDTVASRIKAAHQPSVTEQICISVSPSFAHVWLIQKLSKFHREFSDITLSLNATRTHVNFHAENVDLAIRHGDGSWPGLTAELLMRDTMLAVGSPRLFRGKKQPASLAEISTYPIIEDRIHKYWQRYANLMNETVDINPSTTYDDSGVGVEFAVAGQGIALVRKSLAQAALANNQLTVLFEARFADTLGYYVVYPTEYASRRSIQRVSKWLQREASTPLA